MIRTRRTNRTVSTPFRKAHRRWLEEHLTKRQGERKRRLEEGHGHAEQKALELIWWPVFGNLDYLHPEYEITDFHGGTRFIDLAYIRNGVRIALEIDGYGPHEEPLPPTVLRSMGTADAPNQRWMDHREDWL